MAYVRGGRVKVCEPWPGDLDEDMRPIAETGELVMPGRRLCGHADCMNREHVKGHRRTAAASSQLVAA